MDTAFKRAKRYRRHRRVRAKITGTAKVPRLCVFRSAKYVYAQLIDDENGKILVASSDRELKGRKKIKKIRKSSSAKTTENKQEKVRTAKVAIAFEVGKLIAEKALQKKIEKVIFDRGGYQYHGRVKALAEGAREGGLKF